MPTEIPTIPMTLLDAVNELLRSVGRTVISTLEAQDLYEEAREALQAIQRVAREVQQRGWNYNTEREYPLQPDISGNIMLPANTTRLVANVRSGTERITQRGVKLYDLKNHTYTFDRVVYVDIVLLLDWEEIPPPIRWYITARAGRLFGVARVPDANTFRFSKAVEDEALAAALDFDGDEQDENLPGSSSHFHKHRRR